MSSISIKKKNTNYGCLLPSCMLHSYCKECKYELQAECYTFSLLAKELQKGPQTGAKMQSHHFPQFTLN